MNEPDWDSADEMMEQQHIDRTRVEQRAILFFREALDKGCNVDDALAAIFLAGIRFSAVRPDENPQRRAA